MGVFESLESIEEMDSSPVGVSFSTLEYTKESLVKNVTNGTFSTTKIRSIIFNNMDTYFNYDRIKDPTTKQSFITLWSNMNFLNAVLSLMVEPYIRKIRQTYIRDINTIINDILYYANIDCSPTYEFYKARVSILDALNRDTYLKFQSTGFSDDMARTITHDMYTFMNKWMAYKFVMSDIGKWDSVVSVNDFIYMLSVFCSVGFSDWFNFFMTFQFDPMVSAASAEMNYKHVLEATINILESMSDNEMFKVLTQYSGYITLTQQSKVAMSLRDIGNFPRIKAMVKYCSENGYYIP